jgi:hypothetical protein
LSKDEDGRAALTFARLPFPFTVVIPAEAGIPYQAAARRRNKTGFPPPRE